MSFYEKNLLVSLKEYCLFEIALVNHSGFKLNFEKCVVTGDSKNLEYLSPKSGAVVSEKIGNPYKNLLFALPNFLKSSFLGDTHLDILEIQKSFKISSFFLKKYVLDLHEVAVPKIRERLLSGIENI